MLVSNLTWPACATTQNCGIKVTSGPISVNPTISQISISREFSVNCSSRVTSDEFFLVVVGRAELLTDKHRSDSAIYPIADTPRSEAARFAQFLPHGPSNAPKSVLYAVVLNENVVLI